MKCSSVLEAWKSRSTTITGKTVIVNTLISSLFVYVMQVLPTPSAKLFSKFNSLIHNYLWGGAKRAKISLDVLQSDKELGGARLVNLKIRDQALKIAWIFKMELYINDMLRYMLPDSLEFSFFECNLSPAHIDIFLQKNRITPFWKSVLKAWCEYNYSSKISEAEVIYSQIIWCNSCILIGGAPILDAISLERGVLYVQQLFCNGKMMGAQMLKKFGLSVLRYNQICAAIPSEWKLILKTEVSDLVHKSSYERISNKPKVSSYVYKEIMAAKSGEVFNKIVRNVNVKHNITREELSKAFRDIYKITNITKYRDFQFRLLNKCIHANDRLYYWKITQSQECDWCNEKQTTEHMLFECRKLYSFWKEIRFFITQCMYYPEEESFDFSTKALFLNCVVKKPMDAGNLLVLCAKQYIYYCKCASERVSFDKFIHNYRNLYQIEKYNAIMCNSIDKHNRKWSTYIRPEESDENFVTWIKRYFTHCLLHIGIL